MLLAVGLVGCPSDDPPPAVPEAGTEAGPKDAPFVDIDFGSLRYFCDLPGSLQFTANGVVAVPGGVGTQGVEFLTLPKGYCAHFYGNVGNTRQLRFAPGGELFVASPTKATTGGGSGGLSSIVVLPDDDRDGVADKVVSFLAGLPATQGLLFTKEGSYFYYQDDTKILRMPYTPGNRAPSGTSEEVANVTIYTSSLHWPKTLDESDDGTIYVANGDDENNNCQPMHPFRGGILKLDGTPGGTPVAKGFRNPIALRCQRGHNLCFAVELSRDYSAAEGGREKVVPVRAGDDWGYPCCATKDLPYAEITPTPDCAQVAPENVSFLIGDTPFGVDFERGKWAAPYTGSAFVPLHGVVGTWTGARVVAVEVDPTTGLLRSGSTVDGGASTGAMTDFATGWDDGSRAFGRPSSIEFAPDGRMFIGNDNDGTILWIAPLTLERPASH